MLSYSILFVLKAHGVIEVARGTDKSMMEKTYDKYSDGYIPARVCGDMTVDIAQADILAISFYEIETAEDGRIVGKGLVKPRRFYMCY
jgi:hypothetical protein